MLCVNNGHDFPYQPGCQKWPFSSYFFQWGLFLHTSVSVGSLSPVLRGSPSPELSEQPVLSFKGSQSSGSGVIAPMALRGTHVQQCYPKLWGSTVRLTTFHNAGTSTNPQPLGSALVRRHQVGLPVPLWCSALLPFPSSELPWVSLILKLP